jgi:hypothetical protein
MKTDRILSAVTDVEAAGLVTGGWLDPDTICFEAVAS